MNKKAVISVIVTCFIIVFFGVTIISGGLPKFIKDRSNFKINYTLSPFDFRVDMGDYSMYVNSKVAYNLKNSSVKLMNSIGEKMYNGTSNAINKTTEVFKFMEDKIINKVDKNKN